MIELLQATMNLISSVLSIPIFSESLESLNGDSSVITITFGQLFTSVIVVGVVISLFIPRKE